MRIALVQSRSAGGDTLANLGSVEKAVRGTDADLFVFPELFLSGYDYDGDRREVAECLESTVLDKVSKLAIANDCHVMVGAPSIENGSLFNSLIHFLPDGTSSRYDKIHLADFGPFHERTHFLPGSVPVIAEAGGFKFGLCICYDIFFPEMLKAYALNGADVIVCISASPRSSKTAFDAVLPARAVEDTCYVLFVNNTGIQGETAFFGGTRSISPSGRTLQVLSEEEGIILVTLDRNELVRARVGRPTIRDSIKCIWALG